MYPNMPLQVGYVSFEDTGESGGLVRTTWLLKFSAQRLLEDVRGTRGTGVLVNMK